MNKKLILFLIFCLTTGCGDTTKTKKKPQNQDKSQTQQILEKGKVEIHLGNATVLERDLIQTKANHYNEEYAAVVPVGTQTFDLHIELPTGQIDVNTFKGVVAVGGRVFTFEELGIQKPSVHVNAKELTIQMQNLPKTFIDQRGAQAQIAMRVNNASLVEVMLRTPPKNPEIKTKELGLNQNRIDLSYGKALMPVLAFEVFNPNAYPIRLELPRRPGVKLLRQYGANLKVQQACSGWGEYRKFRSEMTEGFVFIPNDVDGSRYGEFINVPDGVAELTIEPYQRVFARGFIETARAASAFQDFSACWSTTDYVVTGCHQVCAREVDVLGGKICVEYRQEQNTPSPLPVNQNIEGYGFETADLWKNTVLNYAEIPKARGEGLRDGIQENKQITLSGTMDFAAQVIVGHFNCSL
ncbi:MAG: hypothetical protein AB7F43_02010 [Bacteriovoracia bacterium]